MLNVYVPADTAVLAKVVTTVFVPTPVTSPVKVIVCVVGNIGVAQYLLMLSGFIVNTCPDVPPPGS